VGFFAAMKISTYEEMSQVNTYILLPMSFLCGTFFTTQALPGGLRMVIEALPLTHTSMLLRSLASGGGAEGLSLLVIVLYALAGFYLSHKAFAKLAA
jgi:ABC-type polysaccharide/polyol phosphate export permease